MQRQLRALRLRAIRCLAPRASPLAGQTSLGVTQHSANSRTTSLKQGLSPPPLRLSVKKPMLGSVESSLRETLLAREAGV